MALTGPPWHTYSSVNRSETLGTRRVMPKLGVKEFGECTTNTPSGGGAPYFGKTTIRHLTLFHIGIKYHMGGRGGGGA